MARVPDPSRPVLQLGTPRPVLQLQPVQKPAPKRTSFNDPVAPAAPDESAKTAAPVVDPVKSVNDGTLRRHDAMPKKSASSEATTGRTMDESNQYGFAGAIDHRSAMAQLDKTGYPITDAIRASLGAFGPGGALAEEI